MMNLKFLTDENVAKSTVTKLRNLGYDVKDIKEEKLYGIPDEIIIQIAIKEERIIITLDKDFGNILFYPPPLTFGVILIDLHLPKPKNVNKALDKFLKNKTTKDLTRKLFILDEIGARVRG